MGKALDEAWFERFHSAYNLVGETYELLLPKLTTLETKRQEFIRSDYKMNVSLYPDAIDSARMHEARDKLQKLKQDITRAEGDELIKQAYFDSIISVDTNATMMIAAASQDDQSFIESNAVLYESPDPKVFKAVCHWIRHDAQTTQKNADEYLAMLAEKVLDVIPELHDNHQIIIPTESVFQQVRLAHRKNGGYYDMLFGKEGLPTEAYIDEHLGDEICMRILRNIGSEFTMKPSNNNIWAVFPSRKHVVRPSGYRLDRDEFIGIACHEIGSHVLEYELGMKQKIKLLSIGLAGYEKGDEGRAFLREQIVYENERTFLKQFAWEYIALLHLAVSLASGTNSKPYGFSQLYDILFTIYLFWRERRLPRSTNNEAFAHNEAWQLAVRIMKGTDGNGGAYMKDSIYLEGNIRCWQVAENNPDIIFIGDMGKIDISNPTHMKIMDRILQT